MAESQADGGRSSLIIAMSQPDFRGVRGSNAGDDFHELWALRQAELSKPDEELSSSRPKGKKTSAKKGRKQRAQRK